MLLSVLGNSIYPPEPDFNTSLPAGKPRLTTTFTPSRDYNNRSLPFQSPRNRSRLLLLYYYHLNGLRLSSSGCKVPL